MLKPAEFSRLSPEDDDIHAHISVDLSVISFVAFFVPSLLLTAVALVSVNDKIEPWEGNNDTLTQFLLENIELLRNGSYYYNYRNPETGIIDSGIIESWYSHIFEGEYRYDYGSSFNNFCWVVPKVCGHFLNLVSDLSAAISGSSYVDYGKRVRNVQRMSVLSWCLLYALTLLRDLTHTNPTLATPPSRQGLRRRDELAKRFSLIPQNRDEIPEDEWMPSLYRSSQLFVRVQLPIRMAVLVTFTHRLLLLCVAISYKTVMRTSAAASVAAPYLLLNEFLLLISTYQYYSIHTSQDENLFYAVPIISAMMLVTFAVKMFTGNIVQIKRGNALCMVRLAFGFMTGCVASNILRNAHYVSKSMNCDQNVIPMVAVCEYIFLFMVTISYLLDIFDSNSMRVMVSCSAQDAADYGNVGCEANRELV